MADTALSIATARSGRRDAGQEKVVSIDAIRERKDQLLALYRTHQEAGQDLSDAIKATAEASGLNAKAIRSWLAAEAGEGLPDWKRNVRQLSLLAEEDL